MPTYTACIFLNLTSIWPTHPPFQLRRDFTSRAAALTWARMAPPTIPFAEPDVLIVGSDAGQPVRATMVFPDRIQPLDVQLQELAPAEPARTCAANDGMWAETRLEAEETTTSVWMCDRCIRDRATIQAACRRLLDSAGAPQVARAAARRILH